MNAHVIPPGYTRTGRRCRCLPCGGGSDAEPLSFAMREVLEAEGVPPDKIWLETRSRNTYENAVYGCEILRRHGISQIVLVDEARFLPRAVACFRKQGMKVVPAAFNFNHLYWEADDFLPASRALEMNGELIHEYLGYSGIVCADIFDGCPCAGALVSSWSRFFRQSDTRAIELFLHFGELIRLRFRRRTRTVRLQRRLPLRYGFFELALLEINISQVVMDGGILVGHL